MIGAFLGQYVANRRFLVVLRCNCHSSIPCSNVHQQEVPAGCGLTCHGMCWLVLTTVNVLTWACLAVLLIHREDAFQEYVELETVYLDCLEAAALGSAHSGGVGSHADFGRQTGRQLRDFELKFERNPAEVGSVVYRLIHSC